MPDGDGCCNSIYVRVVHPALLTGSLDGSAETQPPPRVRIPPACDVNVLWSGYGLLESSHHVRLHVGIDPLENAKPVWHTDGRRREQRILPLPLGGVLNPRLSLQVRREALCVY